MNYAVILASGEGSRFGGEKLKQLTRVSGKTILEHTLQLFDKNPLIDEIVIVGNAQVLLLDGEFKHKYPKLRFIVPGGASRAESTWMGLPGLEHPPLRVQRLGRDHHLLLRRNPLSHPTTALHSGHHHPGMA